MGNYVSCTLATPLIKNSKASRVVFPGGEVRQFREPVKAAELMLECPSYFVANSQSLHIGRRFSPLSADEDLEFGNVYIMFPMKRASAVVSAADMAVFFMAANSAAKRISGVKSKIRVLPESGGVGNVQEISSQGSSDQEGGSSRLSLEGVEEFQMQEYKYRLSVCRSKKPMLETIKEEPIHSR
ncbi:hypothetical protein Tsubulata_048538 [Turnera subulata]|uniref:DUF4228 domain-containing protein n=1 Tax=Turnera subulata TaxID=218843 RepID=A0A9Q0F095_9ROSI|nr:hypothetical protein Tsubulata_048538 [Turnera subulata]